MNALSCLKALLFIVCIPIFIGFGFVTIGKKDIWSGTSENGKKIFSAKRLMWSWLFGQLLLWCGFQIISVTDIMRENMFTNISKYFSIYQIVLGVVSLALIVISVMKAKNSPDGLNALFGISPLNAKDYNENSTKYSNINESKPVHSTGKLGMILWIVFGIVLFIQVVLGIVLAYREVDDSFYVSEALEAMTVDNLYQIIPTTGYPTEMDYRHSLEPFPVWIAYISTVSGMHPASMSHIILPTVLLPFTYGLYALIGAELLGQTKDKKWILPVFMVLIEVVAMFGYYSTRTPEKFLMTRIRQGKTTLASFVIPAMLLCVICVLEYIKEKKNVDIRLWIMLFALAASGCLCSTLAAFLALVFMAIVMLLIMLMYGSFKHIFPMMVCLLPCVMIIALYLIKG